MPFNKKKLPTLLPGNTPPPPAGSNRVGFTTASKIIHVTVILRGAKEFSVADQQKMLEGTFKTIPRKEVNKLYGASQTDINLVSDYAQTNNLTVTGTSSPRRSVYLKGTIGDIKNAFAVKLEDYKLKKGKIVRCRTSPIFIPLSLQGVIVGVFGLDNRPLIYTHGVKSKSKHPKKDKDKKKDKDDKKKKKHAKSSSSGSGAVSRQAARTTLFKGYTGLQVADIYNFPPATGKNQTIGLIEMSGGYKMRDLDTYFSHYNLKTPSISVYSDPTCGRNAPGTDDGGDIEVTMDIEIAGAAAQDATFMIYYTKTADEQGLINAITAAVSDNVNNPNVISMSLGYPECLFPTSLIDSLERFLVTAKAKNITVIASTGDDGVRCDVGINNYNVEYPASSQWVLACGGTTLTVDENNTITSEIIWNDADGRTGGGYSQYQPSALAPPMPPPYQALAIPGAVNRGLPDVAAVATGYSMYVQGQPKNGLGTSAVPPLYAALICRINEISIAKGGGPLGFINPTIYSFGKNCPAFNDISTVSNIDPITGFGYWGSVGWDECTGFGSPDGTKLLSLF